MSLLGFFQRGYTSLFNPPKVSKHEDAIRLGLLGASTIAPLSVINPAKSHPEVIVAAVAARDAKRAEQYAKKYNIPTVHASYQELLDDPYIDAVYIALPNHLHFEWALRSLQAGKHVLLEKPSCSNSEEAKLLFTHPLTTKTDGPVLLEAFHYQFHPSWQTFLRIIRESEGAVKHASSQQYVPKGAMPIDDIRFSYECAGGSLMDLGTYALSTVRMVLGAKNKVLPIDVQSRLMPLINGNQAEPKIDQAITASLLTESGQRGLIVVDLASQGGWPSFLPESWTANIPTTGWPKCEAVLDEMQIQKEEEGRPEHIMQRTVIIWNYLVPTIYHRIEICDRHYLRMQGVEVKYWKETKYQTAYTSAEERFKNYQDWWTTWRCQLEEFVNRIKGRPGSGVWVDGQESILQMEAIDDIYRKSGLGPRPTSTFRT